MGLKNYPLAMRFFLWFVCPVGAGVRVWAAPRRSQAVDAESTGPMDMAVSYGMLVGGMDGARRGQHNALGIAFYDSTL